MLVDEFKRINLKVIKNDEIIYEGKAEDAPEEIKMLHTEKIKIKPELAEITVISAEITEEEQEN